MKRKRNFYVVLITVSIYILLSWFIAAGNFNNGSFTKTGLNQFGLLDLLLAPINLFNYFAVSMTKNIDGFVNQFSYGNIIIAFIAIAILYATFNMTGSYKRLVSDIANKVDDKKEAYLAIVAAVFFIISALTGLELVLFMFVPFIGATLVKMKYNKETAFVATIGAMILGRLGSLYNPSINGLNQIILSTKIDSSILARIIFAIILCVILIATLLLTRKKEVTKEEEILLLDDEKDSSRSYVPIIVSSVIVTIILFVCMYNWYYIFDTDKVTKAYNTLLDLKVRDYAFMKNIFGMSESFGYWTGFTMSLLLIIQTLVIKFIYSIKFEDYFSGIKKSISDMLPVIGMSMLSLSVIVLSLHTGNSFIYSIINNILGVFKENQVLGTFLTSFIHSFFINDYFALTSSLTPAFTTIYVGGSIDSMALCTQLAHGFASLLSPLNVYLVAGLTFFGISFKDWLKYIWKPLILILGVALIVLFV